MIPTRRTQPYRKGARGPSAILDAMTRGRTAHGYNPADLTRHPLTEAARSAKKRAVRPKRPVRPARPA